MMSSQADTRFPIHLLSSTAGEPQISRSYEALAAELDASLAREAACLREKKELSERQVMLTREFEHRLVNGMQLVVSMLSLQSRTATTKE